MKKAVKDEWMEHSHPMTKFVHLYTVGAPCCALYRGPTHTCKCNKKPWWVPAVVTKIFGTQSDNVHVFPRGRTWLRHINQLHAHYRVEKDTDPGKPPTSPVKCPTPEDGGNAKDKDTGDH